MLCQVDDPQPHNVRALGIIPIANALDKIHLQIRSYIFSPVNSYVSLRGKACLRELIIEEAPARRSEKAGS